jgi:damage-control phosphatase, subfamily I
MVSDYRCFFCFAKAYEKLLNNSNLNRDQKHMFTQQMAELYAKEACHFSAPKFSRQMRATYNSLTGNCDPYSELKKSSNDLVLSQYQTFKEQITSSVNSFDTALRLSIAGNIMDYAALHTFDLQTTINQVLHQPFAIDHSALLHNDIKTAQLVLYLGDNCGEIVFDKLFIEQLNHPNLVYAVRGAPTNNDATLEDALYVGINEVTTVISNGYDAPSTLLKYCTEEFQDLFNKADVVISKGQGNLEGLLGQTHKNVYFLLMVKCDTVADALGVKKGSFVVTKNN